MADKKNTTHGSSMTRRSTKRSLGPYVVLKKRAGGKARAYFQVPARLRPEGWAPAIPIGRQFELTDDIDALPNEVYGSLLVEGAQLFERFDSMRNGGPKKADTKSLLTLVRNWQKSSRWHDLSPKTREGYGYSIDKILTWSEIMGHPDPTLLTRAGVEKFLSKFNDRPTTKRQTHKALRLVMDQAIAAGWRTDNPCAGITIKVPKTKAVIWEQADVDLYVSIAREQGMESIALIILLEWEIGQRLTDVRQFRPGAEYNAQTGVFAFKQSKTDEPVAIEISSTLREMLKGIADDQMFLFRNERTGKAYTENRLSQSFRWIRVAAIKAGGRELKLRQLRHSCVVQLARAQCTVPEIAAITGHSLGSVNSILSTYLPRDSMVARNAQIKRGLIDATPAFQNKTAKKVG
ncbi:tyrosine-type recombinase/integrase [Brevundimonas sp.]|uniref:tyrosine-type recombinase/integrase n=1 Tax=Brevundimonas sp. TaxID=1871086 RepID=UPI00289BF4CC|nr:tyrosine-type recombinase/integrase [Brevundimonas sp.]